MPLNVEDIPWRQPRRTRSSFVRAVRALPPQPPAQPHAVAPAVCAVDGMPLFATVVGPRCPLCGAASLGVPAA